MRSRRVPCRTKGSLSPILSFDCAWRSLLSTLSPPPVGEEVDGNSGALQNGLTSSQTQGPLRTHIHAMFLHTPLFAEGLGATSSTRAHGNIQTTLLKSNLSSNLGTQSYASIIVNGPKPPDAEKQKDKGCATNETQDHNGQNTQSQGDSGLVIQIEALDDWYKQLQERVVIGLCHGIRPSVEGLKTWMAQTWKNRNILIEQVQYLPNGYYLLFFRDSNSALQVASQGQWLIKSTPMSVFKWFPGFNPRGPKPTCVPVWIDFPDLPVEFLPWLSDLARLVGKVMGQKNRGDINPKWDPQVLVEVDISKSLLNEVPIRDSMGNLLHVQKIVYRNLPNACFLCMKQGHLIKDCPEAKGPSSEGNKGNKTPKIDAQAFQIVNKKNWSKIIKPNKPPPNKFHNMFQPLLTKVYDPCQYALSDDQFEEPEVPLEQHQRMPDQEKDIPFHEFNLPSQPNKETESKSSSDSEEECIPNTQQNHQLRDLDLFAAQLEKHDMNLKEHLSQIKEPNADIDMRRGHAQHEEAPTKDKERSKFFDESMEEDVALQRCRAQRSPTLTKRKRSPCSPPHCESKREEKNSRKKKERKRSPSSPSSSPPYSLDESGGYSSKESPRRGHRISHAAWRRSNKLKKFKEGGKSISFLTYDGTFGATDKVLVFIQQFDATFEA
ncbi:hypothetical protein L7F22_022748 [Adiantum nelumboides]|nr:hypothetical protein [Adiantum nelumboides]